MKNNTLIAEFMGIIKYSEQHDGMYCAETMELGDFPILFQDNQYNTSWDWLMPVLKKINLQLHPDTYGMWRMINTPTEYTIEEVHAQAVYFIKTYNDERQ